MPVLCRGLQSHFEEHTQLTKNCSCLKFVLQFVLTIVGELRYFAAPMFTHLSTKLWPNPAIRHVRPLDFLTLFTMFHTHVGTHVGKDVGRMGIARFNEFVCLFACLALPAAVLVQRKN